MHQCNLGTCKFSATFFFFLSRYHIRFLQIIPCFHVTTEMDNTLLKFFLPGFNAAVAGCFFAIETVLRSNKAENSPPFTTAMIILASVISSTVSNVSLGTQSAFSVPAYDLKSAAG